MGLSKIAISLILICAAFNVATLFPKLQILLGNVLIILRSWLPSVIDLVEEIAVGLHKYCTERLLEDIKKGFTIVTGLFSSVFTLIQPAVGNVFKVITDALIAFHNNGMGYTDEILQQLLGIDGAALPDHVGSARNKLLSLILFLVWIITGLVCISRMSYNKFFLLMSSTFLVHAFFGPVWCLRRLAFCIGVCMWMGSLVSNKPIPAAITVLVAFTLTGLRKWRKKVAMTTKTSDLLKLNESLEQRLDGIEKKLDVLVSKLNVICGGSS